MQDEYKAKLLEEERALAFHHTMAQLLFMSTRARRDIQTALAFLTTKVKTPDEDNWEKLKRVLKYLNGTKYLKLKLSMEDLGLLKWYVDGSHNTHWDCKGCGGAMFYAGKGSNQQLFAEIEAKHMQFHGDGAGNAGHVHARNVVVIGLHRGTGVQCGVCGALSWQHQYTTPYQEWEVFEWKEDKAYQGNFSSSRTGLTIER